MSEPVMAPPVDEDSAAPGWQERRGLIAVATVAVVALLGLGLWFLVLSGDEPEDGLVASARNANATAAPQTPAAEPIEAEELPEAFELDLGNDPFKPLYEPVVEPEVTEPVAGTGAVAQAPVPGSVIDQTDQTGPTGVAPGVVGGAVSQVGTQGSTQGVGGTTVELVSVDRKTQEAVLRVDGESVKVSSGDSFGPGNTLTLHRISEDSSGRGVVTVYQGDDLEGTGETIAVGGAHSF